MDFYFGYIGAFLAGLSLGLVGGGGSILIVPILVYLFDVKPELATAYSLFVVGSTSWLGVYQYAQHKLLDLHTVAAFGMPTLVGVLFSRSILIPFLPPEVPIWGYAVSKDTLIMTVFAGVMLSASYFLIAGKKEPSSISPDFAVPKSPRLALVVIGILTGILTGFVGAGGGFIIVPILIWVAKLPIRLTVGTSLMIVGTNSLLGFMGDFHSFWRMDWVFLTSVTAVAMLGIFLGVLLSRRISGNKLRPGFGWFVFAMGCWILWEQTLS